MFKFLLKWIVNGTIIVAFLMYYSNTTFMMSAVIATGLTLLAYLIGDQVILRLTNNGFAAVCDALLAIVYFGILSYAMDLRIYAGEIIFLAVLIGVVEWVLHRYVFNDPMRSIAGS
ncbi:DUF2512 family protein [Paenibacillus daejeonensis]|uniref:DUF2512 family protein n=1 Tax=Paenibacillus daejeonensis TaxID=135193 RepID=UPI00037D2EE4|nr:DUF2512 family protein [Paenibacillus daejeonensis]